MLGVQPNIVSRIERTPTKSTIKPAPYIPAQYRVAAGRRPLSTESHRQNPNVSPNPRAMAAVPSQTASSVLDSSGKPHDECMGNNILVAVY